MPDDRPHHAARCPSCQHLTASLPPGVDRKTLVKHTRRWLARGDEVVDMFGPQVWAAPFGHSADCRRCPDAGAACEPRPGAAAGPGG